MEEGDIPTDAQPDKKRLKNETAGHMSFLTRLYRDVEGLMTNYINIELVKEKVKDLESAFDRFVHSHKTYYKYLEDSNAKKAIDESYQSHCENKREFDYRVNEWLISAQSYDASQIVHHNDDCSVTSNLSRSSVHSNLSADKLKDARVNLEIAKLEMKQLEEQMRIENELQSLEKRRCEMEKERKVLQAENRIERAKLQTYMWEEEVAKENLIKTEVPNPSLKKEFPVKTEIKRSVKMENSNLNPNAREWPAAETSKPQNVPKKSGLLEENLIGILKHQLESMQSVAQAIREGSDMPKPELLKFDGNPVDYWKFINNFETNIGSRSLSYRTKLSYLIQQCIGEPRNSIEECVLYDPEEGYYEARNILRSEFGQPHVIAHAYVDHLASGPPLKGPSDKGLAKLAREMRKCNITLTQMGYTADMNNSENLKRIVRRLPFYMRTKWAETADKIIQTGVEPDFAHLTKFVQDRVRVSNNMYGQELSKHSERKAPNPKFNGKHAEFQRKVTTFATRNDGNLSAKANPDCSSADQNSRDRCPFCLLNHNLANCKKFISVNRSDRIKFTRQNRLCDNCFVKGHIAIGCLEKRACSVDGCNRKHHTLLHPYNSYSQHLPNQQDSLSESNNRTGQCNATVAGQRVCLRIVPVKVYANGHKVETYAILDDGSDTSLCSNKLIENLGVAGKDTQFSLTTVNNERVTRYGKEVSLNVSGIVCDDIVELPRVWSVEKLPISGNAIPKNSDFSRWPHLKGLSFPNVEKREVTLLIGSDVPEVFWTLEERRGRRKEPYGVRSLLGWSLIGPTEKFSEKEFNVHCMQGRDELLQRQIECLWNTDFRDSVAGPEVAMSKEDCTALEIMKKTVTKVEGHYEVGLPWRKNCPNLPNNRFAAECRMRYLKRRLLNDQNLFEKYKQTINSYISNGYARQIPSSENDFNELAWYLPHHPVFHPQKPNKVRVVFDCAAKYMHTSLNDQLLQGPDLCNSLIGVLLRFRKELIAMVGDIEAMFHQIKVPRNDSGALRFLWWPNDDLNATPVDFEMKVHIFGAKSSPSCASFCLQKTAQDNECFFDPEVIHALRNGFYVDDLLKSVASERMAIELVKKLCECLKQGGFRLHKWICNNRNVLESIPKSERSNSVLNIDLEKLPVERTLGIQWNTENDEFEFKIIPKIRPYTRRGILSVMSSLYDPLGFVSPFLLPAKLILQELCRRNLGWDEEITYNDKLRWNEWMNDLPKLENITISRCLKPSNLSTIVFLQIHNFADASQYGYGAVSYIRMVDEHGAIHCAFLIGKSRLAPLKKTTIPRLELTAAVLAVKLDGIVEREMELPKHETFFWTDSTSVLQFIRNKTKRFPIFIANRLAKLEEGSDETQWKYVDTKSNPADYASRGVKASSLTKLKRWLDGPKFLWKPESEWPCQPDVLKEEENSLDCIKPEDFRGHNVHCISKTDLLHELICNTYSSWNRLKRAVALLLRVKRYLLYRVRGMKRVDIVSLPTHGYLKIQEMDMAEKAIIAYVQGKVFSNEISILKDAKSERGGGKKAIQRFKFVKSLHKLNPVILDGLLRVGGRLENAPISYEAKHPPILPNKHNVTDLIIQDHHMQVGHSGVGMTWASLRQQYWIVRGGVAVRRVLGNCFDCKRRNGPHGKQLMADLPAERVTSDKPPFNSVGIDFFGPLYVKQGRSQIKRYGCLFTCLSIRAVHIEIAHSLETDSFIQALRRFISRRGKPELVWSDNGTNLIGAEKEMRESIDSWNQNKINSFLLRRNIQWKFSPPYGSHFGGVWERLVKSVKKIMKALLKEQLINDEALLTLVAEVESILNSRPLTPISIDPRDGNPLTPNHLLLLREQSNTCPGTFTKEDLYHRRRWRQVQYLADQFWKRWIKEYLPTLQIRQKWTKSSPNFKVGDVVLVTDPSKNRGQWPLGRITEVFPDKYGKVRQVQVRTSTSVFRRPIVKLCHLLDAE